MDNPCDKQVLALCDEFWQWRLKESPEMASYFGFHQFDDRWDDVSEEAYIRREACVREFLKKAEAIDVKLCSQDVALSHTVLMDDLQLYLRGVPFRTYIMPLSSTEGFHLMCNLTISYMKFNTDEDFNKYISRLEKLPQRVEQIIQVLKRGVEEEIMPCIHTIRDVPDQIQKLLDTPIHKVELMKPFSEDHPGVPAQKINEFKGKAQKLIETKIFPTLTKMKTYLAEEYFPHVRTEDGLHALNDGDKWYQQCLDFYLTCYMSPQQVYSTGLKEVTRIREKILRVAEKENLGQNMPEILTNLNKRSENFFTNKEEVVDYTRNLCANRIRPKLPLMFKNLPDKPMKVDGLPEYLRNVGEGIYLSGTLDGSREGCFYIQNLDLKHCAPHGMMALSLHEGEPGHHLQGVYALAASHLPDFRRYNGDTKYYLSPHRFGFNTAYAEGWGLYCEALGEELDLYQDNLELLGRYKFEIFRAARLVVDTGLHAFGWSKEKAVEYMVENTLSARPTIEMEVDRYICLPGQACAYKVGEIKIWEMRRKAEEKLGEHFDIKDFHQRLLSCGAVPLRVLEMIVDQYIDEVKAIL